MEYIKVELEKREGQRKYNFFQKLIIKIAYSIFPKANPDFEKEIDLVFIWYLEFDDTKKAPIRELGLDNDGKVIAKMPYKDNYGYWTDNNLNYDDFLNTFKTQEISKEEFEMKWSSFGDLKYEQ